MKCPVCDNDTDSIDSKTTLCTMCEQLNQSDLFSKILATLLDIYTANKGFDAVKSKCLQFDPVIKSYPLYVTPFCTFDSDVHDTDRDALHYLQNYVISPDNTTLQHYRPIRIDTPYRGCLYKTIAVLCQLNTEDGAKELKVRNVVDMILNANVYQSADPRLHSGLKQDETWKHFVLEQLLEKQLINELHAALTLSVHSLSNILHMRIRSVYPKVSGGNEDHRKQLDRIFSPLDIQANPMAIPTITILWSNTKKTPLNSPSPIWIPEYIVPLLPKSDHYTNDTPILSRTNSVAGGDPAERSFYMLSCFCSITQSTLNEIVSDSDQQKHLEAEIKNKDTKLPEFRCPKCSKLCNNYGFDWKAVTLFRQNFTGACLTYILVDTTSSMTSNLPHTRTTAKKSSSSRIIQTKEAIKQLLKEIATNASPLDQAILAIFDDKLQKSAVIPLCNAKNIDAESNLTRIDALKLSPRSVETHFYSVLREVYEMLEREAFLYIDLYVFSDGIDTSLKRNDTTYQAIIRGLNEKLGAKCHFMNCGSASQGFSVAAWLGDKEADCPISGSIDEIKTQVKAAYKKDQARNPNLPSSTTRFRGKTLNILPSTANANMTDAEAPSVGEPRTKDIPKDKPLPLDSSLPTANRNPKNLDDFLATLHSVPRPCSTTAPDSRSKSTTTYQMRTRHVKLRQFN